MDVKSVMNVLFSRSFHFGTVVGGLNILPQASIKMTKIETSCKNDGEIWCLSGCKNHDECFIQQIISFWYISRRIKYFATGWH